MRTLRYAMIAFFLSLSIGLALPACHPHVTPENAHAAAALTADSIVIRLNEVQAAVIQACGPGRECAPNTIPTATADVIVQTAIDLRTVLKNVPTGWQATVKSIWAQARPRFGTLTNPAIIAALAAVDLVIGGL